MKKLETSKLFLLVITVLSIFIVVFSVYQVIKLETTEPLIYLIPAIFAELAAATGFYYSKAKAENKAKIIIAAVKEISKEDELTDCQTRIIESLTNNLMN